MADMEVYCKILPRSSGNIVEFKLNISFIGMV